MKHPCPRCGELLHFRKVDRKELFCSLCGLIDTFHFDASEIYFLVQKERRKEKGSIGKIILADNQRHQVLIKPGYWLVYDLGYSGKVFFDSETKEYDFKDESEGTFHFPDIGNLIEYFDDRASNMRLHRGSQ